MYVLDDSELGLGVVFSQLQNGEEKIIDYANKSLTKLKETSVTLKKNFMLSFTS